MAESRKVAVIGAGVAGLVTAPELQREGHRVTVFEKSNQLGGIWVYTPRVDETHNDDGSVHSSLYKSLRTNLPRQLMSFTDYPFNVTEQNGKLLRNYPGHEAVLQYLNNFAKDFGITELIRFNTEVVRVELFGKEEDRWVVVESKSNESSSSEEVFDSAVICNGHYTKPRFANIPGINNWPGIQIHSHNYRVPEPFKDQVVVVIGDGPSGLDISGDIVKVAKQVHLSKKSSQVEVSKLENVANLWSHSTVDHVDENGEVTFLDGTSIHADSILHCTGYKYDFPFLKTNGIVSIDDNRVGPLYKHVFPPKLSPWLSFVGITYHTIVFLTIELQAKWIAKVLSGKVLLPSDEEMLTDIEDYYRHLEEAGIPKNHTHRLRPHQFEYMDWVAAQMGMPPVDVALKDNFWDLYKFVGEVGVSCYRDLWEFKNLSP